MSGAMRTNELLAAFCVLLALGTGEAAAQGNCTTMRKINIGVSVAPPNVVHTSPYVAFELGLFAKHCVDANIIQFDGGESPASTAAVAQGTAIANISDVAIGRGMKAQQIWGLAPRPPQVWWACLASARSQSTIGLERSVDQTSNSRRMQMPLTMVASAFSGRTCLPASPNRCGQ